MTSSNPHQLPKAFPWLRPQHMGLGGPRTSSRYQVHVSVSLESRPSPGRPRPTARRLSSVGCLRGERLLAELEAAMGLPTRSFLICCRGLVGITLALGCSRTEEGRPLAGTGTRGFSDAQPAPQLVLPSRFLPRGLGPAPVETSPLRTLSPTRTSRGAFLETLSHGSASLSGFTSSCRAGCLRPGTRRPCRSLRCGIGPSAPTAHPRVRPPRAAGVSGAHRAPRGLASLVLPTGRSPAAAHEGRKQGHLRGAQRQPRARAARGSRASAHLCSGLLFPMSAPAAATLIPPVTWVPARLTGGHLPPAPWGPGLLTSPRGPSPGFCRDPAWGSHCSFLVKPPQGQACRSTSPSCHQ